MNRPPTNAQQRAANRHRHYQERAQAAAALGSKGTAASWAERVRGLARDRALRGDPGGWVELAGELEQFCARHPPADKADRRAARRAWHWETRRAGLADADPRTIALAWWDRARAVAAEQDGEAGWNDLGLTLMNLSSRYGQ
ncbi:hypothetical protein ACGFXC_36955 [Streptomyces sp. NPDC048507]|uniref:hypothetical protein n=1 Tax=Streptomyces sp. NPDC048507 TaxID=3365560 RepID=UPI0037240508